LAWLTAFNSGLFNELELSEINRYLAIIEREAETTSLTLESPPEHWRQAVNGWITSGNPAS
jgi:F-type H+-transporting ATPase subunit alpha